MIERRHALAALSNRPLRSHIPSLLFPWLTLLLQLTGIFLLFTNNLSTILTLHLPPRAPPHNFCFGCLFLLLFSVSAYNGLNPSEVSLIKADLIDLVMRTEAGQTEKKGSPDIKISEPGDGWEEGEAGILGLTYMYYYT